MTNRIEYPDILPGRLTVVKFSDNYYNPETKEFIANINDMGRTNNAISYLISSSLCSWSPYFKTNILDSRGIWQIKKQINPALDTYTINCTYGVKDYNLVLKEFSLLPVSSSHQKSSGVDKLVPSAGGGDSCMFNKPILDCKLQIILVHFINRLAGYFKDNMLELYKLSITFQLDNTKPGQTYFILDNINLADDWLFTWKDVNSWTTEYCNVPLTRHIISEPVINTYWNRLFMILNKVPGFLQYKTDQPSPNTVKRITYDAKTIEKYITDANAAGHGKYF